MRILAVDYNGLFARHALVNNAMDLGKATQGVLSAVATHRQSFDRVALCVDSGKSWRASIWPGYKANREDRGEPYREQLRATLDRLVKDGCVVFRAPEIEGGYAEADDVIGTLCNWAREGGHEVMILSADKDMFQLVQDGVGVISLASGSVYADRAAVTAKMGVPPEHIADLLALMGDTSDNYKVCDGVGPKTAQRLIELCGHALAVLRPEHWDRLHEKEYLGDALGQKFRATVPQEKLFAATRVATILRDLPIDFEPLLQEPVFAPLTEDAAPAAEAAPVQAVQVSALAPRAAVPAAALAVRPAALHEVVLPYWAQPNYLGSLWDVAKAFHSARCFPNVMNPEQVMVVGMMAHEDGIGLATAMQHAYFVHGRLCWSATYLLMRARASGEVDVFDVIKSNDLECMIRVKRRGSSVKDVSFKLDEAVRAQLVKADGNWKKWPVEMLLARCIARALRQEFRDLIGGRYVPEEMSDEIPEEQILRGARESRAALAPQAQAA